MFLLTLCPLAEGLVKQTSSTFNPPVSFWGVFSSECLHSVFVVNVMVHLRSCIFRKQTEIAEAPRPRGVELENPPKNVRREHIYSCSLRSFYWFLVNVSACEKVVHNRNNKKCKECSKCHSANNGPSNLSA